jgi:hypothetical protein
MLTIDRPAVRESYRVAQFSIDRSDSAWLTSPGSSGPGRLRSQAAAVGDHFSEEHGIGEALIEHWNGSAWSITA